MDIESGTIITICDKGTATDEAEFFNQYVIWWDERNFNPNPGVGGVSLNMDLYLYHLETNSETKITDTAFDEHYPRIHEQNIVWSNSNNELIQYNLESKEKKILVKDIVVSGISLYQNNLVYCVLESTDKWPPKTEIYHKRIE
jgi:hypothetical protein